MIAKLSILFLTLTSTLALPSPVPMERANSIPANTDSSLKRDFEYPNGQNDGYPYPTVQFTNSWPSEFKSGEGNEAQLSWTGGSGRYDAFWLESWSDRYGKHSKQYYFFRNETYTQYSFYFSPSRCWHQGASILFGIQEGGVQAGSVTQRDHATGPLLNLIRGPDDVYNTC